ncbi:MAG: trigger factor [Candidatus Midichloria sp.]|uniref:peptidylprolyl isomerase n=1 Tax=Hyalomma marginatum TaxID=34627 RepID=A0A8S4BVL7_9ACAR|nr:trigger factor [Hyalomma marginatum]CAG7592459.1 trigger factor [Hyalomma marginatum]
MEIQPIKKEGLFREYTVIVPSEDIKKKVDEILAKEAETFKMPGFREGKVPISLVRRQIGGEVLQKQLRQSIDDAVKAILKESQERPAMPPEIQMNNFDENTELKITISFDALPKIPEIDLTKVSFDGYEIEVLDSDMEKAKGEILKRSKNFQPAEDGYKAQVGDMLKIDFVGKIDGVEFEGGKGEGIKLEIGSKQFVPGFEEQLVGLAVSEEKTINVVFSQNYPKYPGKEVTFDIKVHEILRTQDTAEWNDELAKKLGFEKIENIEKMIKDRMSTDFAVMARFHTKKELFDILDREYEFELPQRMLEADLEQLIKEAKAKPSPETQDKSEEELNEEFKKISFRRVKLGLLLAELARINKIEVSENDLRETIAVQVMQMPDKQKEIIEYFSKPENLRMLEGPILEEKTVDFILTKVNLNKIKITAEEFSKKNLII